jgi:hypothetical protein
MSNAKACPRLKPWLKPVMRRLSSGSAEFGPNFPGADGSGSS